jgi:hypothetical protein
MIAAKYHAQLAKLEKKMERSAMLGDIRTLDRLRSRWEGIQSAVICMESC